MVGWAVGDTNASAVVGQDSPERDDLRSATLVRHATADVGRSRETLRRKRLLTLVLVVGAPTAYLWYRILSGNRLNLFNLPSIDPLLLIPSLFFLLLMVVLLGQFVFTGRSPHVMYRPEQIETRLEDVKGIDPVKEDVVRSLNLFLAHKSFSTEMGGTPRRGLLFEGAPGTGKTYLAKAMAREAGVPFLFVSATSFQSMYYGATARKIRSYFRALRKAARRDGGAIGFIEEIDAIAMTRGGMSAVPAPSHAVPVQPLGSSLLGYTSCGWNAPATALTVDRTAVTNRSTISEGTGGVVNELL